MLAIDSDVQHHSRLPFISDLAESEAVKGDGLDVGVKGMPMGIHPLSLQFDIQGKGCILSADKDGSAPQQ